jgi:hypothetical protein
MTSSGSEVARVFAKYRNDKDFLGTLGGSHKDCLCGHCDVAQILCDKYREASASDAGNDGHHGTYSYAINADYGGPSIYRENEGGVGGTCKVFSDLDLSYNAVATERASPKLFAFITMYGSRGWSSDLTIEQCVFPPSIVKFDEYDGSESIDVDASRTAFLLWKMREEKALAERAKLLALDKEQQLVETLRAKIGELMSVDAVKVGEISRLFELLVASHAQT